MKLFSVRASTICWMTSDIVYRFDLTSPYDISTCTYVAQKPRFETAMTYKMVVCWRYEF